VSYDPYTPPENPYQQPLPPQGFRPPQTSGFAITALVLGILSLTGALCCFTGILGIPAVIFGHIARGNIRNSNGQITGDGMALAGLICGYISIALMGAVFIYAIIAGGFSSSSSYQPGF